VTGQHLPYSGSRSGPRARSYRLHRRCGGVAAGDKAAGADVVRSTAQRADATITELDGSHVIMISQPEAVTEVILAAVRAVSPSVAVSV
jgi:hypothetical protein